MNTVLGIIVIVGDIASYVAKSFEENPPPTTVSEWILRGSLLFAGAIGIVSKQWNVSKSSAPAAAITVTPEIASKPNPVAASEQVKVR